MRAIYNIHLFLDSILYSLVLDSLVFYEFFFFFLIYI